MRRTASIQIAPILGSRLCPPSQPHKSACHLGPLLLQTQAIRDAVDFAKTDEMRTIEDQIRSREVEAPPFQEAKRAELFAEPARAKSESKDVRIDAEGNVIGERPGARRVIRTRRSSVHLDAVVSPGNERESLAGRAVLHGAGIGRRLAVGSATVIGGRAGAEQSRCVDAWIDHVRRHRRRRGARRLARREAPLQRDAERQDRSLRLD